MTLEVSTEVTLLQILKHRREYDSLTKAVPKNALIDRAKMLLADFGQFFKEFPDLDVIPHAEFSLWFKGFKRATRTPEQLALDGAMIDAVLTRDAHESLRAGILGRLVEREAAMRVTEVLTKYDEGAEIDLLVALRDEVRRFEDNSTRKVKVPLVEPDIEAQLLEDQDDSGLRWQLPELNAHMRPLRVADFIIWAGRPGRGKTSGLVGETIGMPAQFDEYYGPDSGREMIWLNNEGKGNRIWRRMVQSALNASNEELIAYSNAGVMWDKFNEVTHGGRSDNRIRVLDIHRFYNSEVEDTLARFRPGLIVFDMVDNVKFRGASMSGDRTDLTLEAMYQWARELAVVFDCPVIATSQSSVDASDVQFPKDHMLKDSKTGKQGACDGIIFMGTSKEGGENERYISVAKSKLNRPGVRQSPDALVMLDNERCRLVSPKSLLPE